MQVHLKQNTYLIDWERVKPLVGFVLLYIVETFSLGVLVTTITGTESEKMVFTGQK